MPETKRATVYFDPALHTALRLKAASTQTSISKLVNDAVREALRQDKEDLTVFEERKHEPTISYEGLLEDLRRHGKI